MITTKIPEFDTKNTFKILVFNCGQGNNALLKLPSGKYALIDFFYSGIKDGMSEPPGITFLRNIDPNEIVIKMVCITHTDYDHIKGTREAIDELHNLGIQIEEYWLPKVLDLDGIIKDFGIKNPDIYSLLYYDKSPEQINRIRNTLGIIKFLKNDPKVKKKRFIEGIKPISIDKKRKKDFEVVALSPLGEFIESYNEELIKNLLSVIQYHGDIDENTKRKKFKSSADRNAVSNIILFNFFGHQIVFPGDATLSSWNRCLEEFNSDTDLDLITKNIAVNFILATHHGSLHNSSEDLWNNILPDSGCTNIVFSAGKGKRFLHPDTDTLNDIKNSGNKSKVKTYSTNRCVKCIHNYILNTEDKVIDVDLFEFRKRKHELIQKHEEETDNIINMLGNSEEQARLADNSNYAKESNGRSLLAYYFLFTNENQNGVSSKLIFSPGLVKYDSCLFEEHASEACKMLSQIT